MENTTLDYLEFNFISAQIRNIANALNEVNMRLNAKPNDIALMGQRERLSHDLDQLIPIINNKAQKLCEGIEHKFGLNFKFLTEKPDHMGMKVTK